MSFTDVLKSALAKKHAALHPDAENKDDVKDSKKTSSRPKPVANKPQKKVTGRGR